MITVDVDLKEMGQIIADIKQKVERLMEISGGMQCVIEIRRIWPALKC